MPTRVPDDGPLTARIVLVGEMPGREEEARGKPFVGRAGQTLARWWQHVGIDRREVYITNVVPYRHNPHDDIKLVPPTEVAHWTAELHRRLARLADPVVIVPTGNTALRALVGLTGITRHRGSIYSYRDLNGRTVKVIPTIHPAAILRQPGWERRCLADWRRIVGDSQFHDLRLPQREHLIKPTLDDILAFLEEARRAEVLAIDLETPREVIVEPVTTATGKLRHRRRYGDRRITCVGLAWSPTLSLTIPTTASYWPVPDDLDLVWRLIEEVCSLPCEKAFQNGLFDTWWLAMRGIRVVNWRWDTRWMSHARDPLDAHDLAYQASIHTREPYWKDDTKEVEDRPIPDLETFWRYCGKDAAVTRELADIHHRRLGEGGVRWYDRHYRRLFAPLLAMSVVGIGMDHDRRRKRLAAVLAERVAIQDKLTALAGCELYGPKGSLSHKRLAEFLYGRLGLPERRNRKTGRATTNEVAVRSLMLRHPKALGRDGEPDRPGPLILRHRRLEALGRFMVEDISDADGRVRSQFGWVDTMRLRSGKNPRRTGTNSQNIDRELLDLYVPAPGRVFLEVDLSQAEDRIVKMLTRSPRLIERARAMPWENDEHKRAAAILFGYDDWRKVPSGNGTTPETGLHRYLGKRVRHAGNYGMRGRKLSEELLKEGVIITPEEGDRMIATLLDRDTPEVREWQREVRQSVIRDRAIANSWGLVWDLTHERVDDDLFRRAYAMRPQSEVVMIVNQWGLWPLWQYIEDRHIPAQIVNQKHDSILVETPPEHAWDLACFLKRSLERPRVYAGGHELVIPCEFKLGRTAAGDVEFKRFPSREQFEEAAYGLAAGA